MKNKNLKPDGKENQLIVQNGVDNFLVTLEEYKEKQLSLVKENPFVPIEDNKSYDEGKKARAALRSGRTSLQNEEKTIASKIQEFRKMIGAKTQELISITVTAEEKQDYEVQKWEKKKADEKAERERLEAERISAIKENMSNFLTAWTEEIDAATMETIGDLPSILEQAVKDECFGKFEEFQPIFDANLDGIKKRIQAKKEILEIEEESRIRNAKLEEQRKENEELQRQLAEAERMKSIYEGKLREVNEEKPEVPGSKKPKPFVLTAEEEQALGGNDNHTLTADEIPAHDMGGSLVGKHSLPEPTEYEKECMSFKRNLNAFNLLFSEWSSNIPDFKHSHLNNIKSQFIDQIVEAQKDAITKF